MRLEHGSYGKKLLPDGKYLMEVKISGAVPLWFTKIISGLNVYPVSFSKYGTEYKQYVLTNYESEQKQFIDELRVRNGNLNITMGTMPNSDGGNLN